MTVLELCLCRSMVSDEPSKADRADRGSGGKLLGVLRAIWRHRCVKHDRWRLWVVIGGCQFVAEGESLWWNMAVWAGQCRWHLRACLKVGRASWLLITFPQKIEQVLVWVQFVALQCLGCGGAAMEGHFPREHSEDRDLTGVC